MSTLPWLEYTMEMKTYTIDAFMENPSVETLTVNANSKSDALTTFNNLINHVNDNTPSPFGVVVLCSNSLKEVKLIPNMDDVYIDVTDSFLPKMGGVVNA